MTSHRKTVVFWGAGATAGLGMPLTQGQADFLCKLAPPSAAKGKDPDLRSRVRDALDVLQVRPDENTSKPWIRAFHDLLTILGDDLSTVGDNDTEDAPSVGHVTPNAIAAMRTNWNAGASNDELHERIIALRTPVRLAGAQGCHRRLSTNGKERRRSSDRASGSVQHSRHAWPKRPRVPGAVRTVSDSATRVGRTSRIADADTGATLHGLASSGTYARGPAALLRFLGRAGSPNAAAGLGGLRQTEEPNAIVGSST